MSGVHDSAVFDALAHDFTRHAETIARESGMAPERARAAASTIHHAYLGTLFLWAGSPSIRPPAFIRACLDGVRFPRDWWWTLIVIKLLAAAGLLAGTVIPGAGLAAVIGVNAHLLAAAWAHVRARFLTVSFWPNCLGMLGLSLAVLVFSCLPGLHG